MHRLQWLRLLSDRQHCERQSVDSPIHWTYRRTLECLRCHRKGKMWGILLLYYSIGWKYIRNEVTLYTIRQYKQKCLMKDEMESNQSWCEGDWRRVKAKHSIFSNILCYIWVFESIIITKYRFHYKRKCAETWLKTPEGISLSMCLVRRKIVLKVKP